MLGLVGSYVVEFLTKLKDFLAERPETAFLACSLATNVVLFRLYVKEKDAHFATVVRWLPLAEKLTSMFSLVAARARGKKITDQAGRPKE